MKKYIAYHSKGLPQILWNEKRNLSFLSAIWKGFAGQLCFEENFRQLESNHTHFGALSVAMTATVAVQLAETNQSTAWAVSRPAQQRDPELCHRRLAAPEPYQDGGDDECFVCQCLRDINIQTGGVHRQSVVRVPDPNLTAKTTQEDVMNWINTALIFFFFLVFFCITAVVGYTACALHDYLCECIINVGCIFHRVALVSTFLQRALV